MKKLTAEKIDNIMGAMSCIVTGFCLMALITVSYTHLTLPTIA